MSGCGSNQLNNPNSAELLDNGHILIADENNNRVIEVNRHKQIVWSYGSCTGAQLSGAAFASHLPDGNTLITDSNNNRILEVTTAGVVVFEYDTNTRRGSVASPLPTRAVRLKNGNTLISDQFNMQVIEIDPSKNTVFSQGQIAAPGNGFDQLSAPYMTPRSWATTRGSRRLFATKRAAICHWSDASFPEQTKTPTAGVAQRRKSLRFTHAGTPDEELAILSQADCCRQPA